MRSGLLPTLLLAATLTACGTRLPDRAFTTADGGAAPQVAATDSAAAGPQGTASPVPGASASATIAPGQAEVAPAAPGTGVAAPGAPRNTASDVGVTPTTITLGTISSRSNPFDPSAFVGPQYGAQAFVDDLNRHGGIAAAPCSSWPVMHQLDIRAATHAATRVTCTVGAWTACCCEARA